MRFLLNVQPAAHPVPIRSGAIIAQQVSQNLRRFRVASGLDYEGFPVKGVSVFSERDTDVAELVRRATPQDDTFEPNLLRLISTDVDPSDGAVDTHVDLLVIVYPGDQFAWHGGGVSTKARISYVAGDLQQRDAAICDLFQDIMIGNCPSIQSVLGKYLASQRPPPAADDRAAFYAAKARYANVIADRLPMLFSGFKPDKYVSFSSMARSHFGSSFSGGELEALQDLWLGFFGTLSDYFLTAEQASDLVLNGRFRDTFSFERTRRRHVSKQQLIDLLSDRSLVRETGSYVLCLRARNPQAGQEELAAARFGLSSPGRINTLRLCNNRTYREMEPLVRSGVATPIRLFLKRP